MIHCEMNIETMNSPLRAVVATVLLAFAALQAHGQTTMGNMASHMMELQDELPPEKLPPPRRIEGVGDAHLAITAKPEAQMWFDQGLNLYHDFWDYESARAFEQSIRIDANCAMCYWGLYLAEDFYHGTSQNYAGQALAEAGRLAKHASKRERLYIEASTARADALKSPMPGPAFKRAQDLWRRLAREYPKDRQTRIFLAQQVEQKEALAIYEAIFKEAPDDSAANHYYIHALEATDHPERALRSADILARLAPASGHMVHMPGHIFFRMGDYAGAEQSFAASLEVDERYMREQNIPVDNDWNYVHNLMYAIANAMEEGKFQLATTLSGKLNGARGKFDSTLYTTAARDSISRIDPQLPVALRTGDWPRVLAMLKNVSPSERHPHLRFLAGELGIFASGMQAIEARDTAKARGATEQFDAELWRAEQDLKDDQVMQMMHMATPGKTPDAPTHKIEVMPDGLLQPLLSTLSVMSLELRASLAAVDHKTDEARVLFTKAAQEEKALGYREPPNYIRPVGETEGAAMLAAGAWKDAAAGYRRALEDRPKSGLALYGIAISSEKSGDNAAAAKDYATFLEAWKNADAALRQIGHAQAFVAAHH
jgi:tetratricopeptide (TPR) repeat protein